MPKLLPISQRLASAVLLEAATGHSAEYLIWSGQRLRELIIEQGKTGDEAFAIIRREIAANPDLPSRWVRERIAEETEKPLDTEPTAP